VEAEDETTPDLTVREELDLLRTVVGHLAGPRGRSGTSSDYDADLIALRDEIAQARLEDLPPLVEHMTRLQALAAQRGMGDDLPVDPSSPYFGHLQLEEDASRRDVLLGKRTYLAPEDGVRIVDWRNAPVSRMYYCYDEGDDYEEEFGGRVRRGIITARRSVTVIDGELRRVASQRGTFVLRKGRWVRQGGDGPRLSGGQGTATRAQGLSPVHGRLGVDADGSDRQDKHLPEISALLDREQFELIASQDAGLIVVQGGAGSGKTTVGLHRIAFLAYQGPRRYRPRNMMVVVFNQGLAAYVSGVLPALGVNGVRVVTFDRWASEQRRRHVHGLPNAYADWTPPVVSRLKKHPAMLRVLDDMVDRQDEELTARLEEKVSGTPDGARVMTAWRVLARMPLDSRRARMLEWVDGGARIGRDSARLHVRTELAAESALAGMEQRTRDVISDWAELFPDRAALGEAMAVPAPLDFGDRELDEAHRWCVRQHDRLEEAGEEGEEPCLDREDDAILLRLHQLKRGWLRGPGGRLEYDHLMVDEVQDFSALEVAVLMDTVDRRRPVTLAGDTAQHISREGGFDNWDDFLADLGVSGARIEPLRIAYRSTVEIMQVAREVLGPLAGEESAAHRHGAPVEVHEFSDPGQAVDFLGQALRELATREPLANVAVIARHAAQARLYHEGLIKAEVPRLELIADQDFSFSPGVEVTDVRQVKGLEFDYVVMVEVNADSYPDTEEARHLLHVGVTRAAHQLWILTTGRPSPLVPRRLLGEE